MHISHKYREYKILESVGSIRGIGVLTNIANRVYMLTIMLRKFLACLMNTIMKISLIDK